MGNIKEEYLEYDKEAKESAYNYVHALGAIAIKEEERAKRAGKLFGLKPRFLNAEVIYHNKLSELSHEFIEHDLSFFTTPIEENGLVTGFTSNLIGNAFLKAMDDIFIKALGPMRTYVYTAHKLENNSGLFTLVRYLKRRITDKKILDSSEERVFHEIETRCNDYLRELYGFNIKDNGFDFIVEFITDHEFDNLPLILTRDVFPALSKLGYDDIVERLKEYYKDVLDATDKCVQEEMKIFEEIDELLFPYVPTSYIIDSKEEDLYEPPIRGQFTFDEETRIFYMELMNLACSDLDYQSKIEEYKKLKSKVAEYASSRDIKNPYGRQIEPVKKDQQ